MAAGGITRRDALKALVATTSVLSGCGGGSVRRQRVWHECNSLRRKPQPRAAGQAVKLMLRLRVCPAMLSATRAFTG